MKRILVITIMFSVWLWADTAHYTRNSDGIVTDHKTGLQWQDDYSDNDGNTKSAKWINAIAYCEALSLGGYDDWRLPNFNELYYLSDHSKSNPAIDQIFNQTGYADRYEYWSSTSFAPYANAWGTDFNNGFVLNAAKTSTLFVRCVRNGE